MGLACMLRGVNQLYIIVAHNLPYSLVWLRSIWYVRQFSPAGSLVRVASELWNIYQFSPVGSHSYMAVYKQSWNTLL